MDGLKGFSEREKASEAVYFKQVREAVRGGTGQRQQRTKRPTGLACSSLKS
jgi:hypothetical protein